MGFIPFKINSHPRKRNFGVWQEMYYFFQNNKELFMKKYHLISNVESGFHMIKSRFGDITMMKREVSSRNDILCKVLCHNLCVLCQEMFLLGVEFNFAQLKNQSAHLKD